MAHIAGAHRVTDSATSEAYFLSMGTAYSALEPKEVPMTAKLIVAVFMTVLLTSLVMMYSL